MNNRRVILIVMDSVGIGEMPDADEYGDAGASTLGHIAERVPTLSLPNPLPSRSCVYRGRKYKL